LMSEGRGKGQILDEMISLFLRPKLFFYLPYLNI